jgi:hypothetical protein
MKFEQTKRTKVNRTATRASYDKDLFNTIVDEVKFAHIPMMIKRLVNDE